MMQTRKRWTINRYDIGMFLLLLFGFVYGGLSRYIYPSQVVRISTLVIGLLFVVAGRYFRINEQKIVSYVWLLTILVVLYNNQNIARGNYLFEIPYIIFVIAFLFLRQSSNWMIPAFKITAFFGTFYAFFTVLFRFMPSLYTNYIVKLFPENIDFLIRMYNQGGGAGLTQHFSTNGIYVAIGVGTSFATLLYAKNGQKAALEMLFFLMALLFTGKRAHIIFSFLAALYVYYVYKSDKPKGRLMKMIFIVGTLVGAVFLVGQVFPGLLSFVDRFSSAAEQGDVSKGRFGRVALAMTWYQQNKLLGIGWDGFKYAYIDYINVHNIYAQLLCEVGILGSLVFFGLFILNLMHATIAFYRERKYFKKHNDEKGLLLTFSLFIQVFFLLYGVTGNPLYDFQMLIPYVLSCAIGEYYYYGKSTGQ